MSTVVTHIYNEEFLLPYWLAHHKKIFNHGIIIDFNSTDQSLKIIKELVPNWQIIKSPFVEFEAEKLDRFVEELETELHGPRIALTITEFFVGDPNLVRGQIIVPQITLINQEFDEPFLIGTPIHEQRSWGLVASVENVTASTHKFPKGNGRSIHDHPIKYPIGRHFVPVLPSPYLIIRVNDCFFSEEMFTRRLQIQSRIPESDVLCKYGAEHTNSGKGLTKEDLIERQKKQRLESVDLKENIKFAYHLQNFTTSANYVKYSADEILSMWVLATNNFNPGYTNKTYTASENFWEEIEFLKKSYEKNIIFRIYNMAKKSLISNVKTRR